MREISNIWYNYLFTALLKVLGIQWEKLSTFLFALNCSKEGYLHIHGLFWIKNAPEYGKGCDEDIIKFVDSYVSCKADSDDLSYLVNLQTHKHSKMCKKRGHAVCRFNFPLPPMPRTMILEPLSDTDLDENVADMLNEALG